MNRYSRHIQLKGFGREGQDKLLAASVLVVGVGGLGCPALQYLAAAGVGRLGVVDRDVIELNNLQRQVLYATNEVGLPKAEVAARKLCLLNPEIDIRYEVTGVTTENVRALLAPYDIILDCTDNFETRYLLSDATRLLDKPLIFGAIFRYEGQVAVFNVADTEGRKTTYRHLFPLPPDGVDAPDCNETGVLGVLPGYIGIVQATEAIKLITGIGRDLRNRLHTVNLLDHSAFQLEIPAMISQEITWPTTWEELSAFDYAYHCGVAEEVQGVHSDELTNCLQTDGLVVVDVRNPDEMPLLPFHHLRIPLPELSGYLDRMPGETVLFICQSGKRSLAAGRLLFEKTGRKHRILHLEGGVNHLEIA